MKLKIFIIILMSFIFFGVFSVQAANLKDAFSLDYLNKTAGDGAGYNTGKTDPTDIISTIIQIALSFLGVIFLVLMIYGGYLWMTASGNEQQVEKAKGMIKNALIGLIIVIAAYAISYFVVSKLGTATLK
ncbi:hypothetical protein HY798_02700 [Candidatus Falkowbacteria bacterium]|nr:hypothetical protein [Candidatus Falkowbacteria bacterium]